MQLWVLLAWPGCACGSWAPHRAPPAPPAPRPSPPPPHAATRTPIQRTIASQQLAYQGSTPLRYGRPPPLAAPRHFALRWCSLFPASQREREASPPLGHPAACAPFAPLPPPPAAAACCSAWSVLPATCPTWSAASTAPPSSTRWCMVGAAAVCIAAGRRPHVTCGCGGSCLCMAGPPSQPCIPPPSCFPINGKFSCMAIACMAPRPQGSGARHSAPPSPPPRARRHLRATSWHVRGARLDAAQRSAVQCSKGPWV